MKKRLLLIAAVFGFGTAAFSQATDLFISEYAEGSSNNKYVEIYNGTGAAVDLSNYQLWRVSNGGTWPEATESLTGMLADGDVYIVANSSSGPTVLAAADITPGSFASWNGDDAVGLAKSISGTFTLIDAVGEDGADPGSSFTVAGDPAGTANATIVRKNTVCSPNTNWAVSAGTDAASSEWIVLPIDDWTSLGSHTANCSAGCNILTSGITNIACNDNGTPTDDTDDYITFDLDPTGLNLGANYTVSAGTSISPATAVAFGSVSSFSTTPGTAGAGDITITITDDVDATCTLTETVTDPGVCSSAIPDIILSTSSLTDLDYTLNFTTEELSFDIEGITLTDDIVITAPANYLISETTGGPYLSTITLAQTAGAVANTTIYVTGNASTGGIYVEDIIATTNGGLNDTVEVAGEVLFHTPYTIDQVTTVDANGVADSLDVLAELHGVMHCIDLDGNAGYNLVMIDESGSGVTLFDFSDQVTYTNPVEGDSLKVFGFISQFNGLTQFRPDSIALLAQNATLEMPTVVTTLDESTESQYITLENVSLVTPIATWNNGSSNYDITDGTNIFTLRVDSDTDIPGTAAPQGPFNVTGIGGQFDNSAPYDDGYQILPCGIASIVPLCSEVTNTITESACAGFDFNGTSITATGMYVDTLMSAAGCDSIVTLDFTLLTVDATITFASGEMTANAVGATYEWFDCITGLSIAGETAQTFVPTMNGSYGVYVTENGCTDTSACEVVANVGLEVNPLNNVNVYPNPVTKTLTVDLANLQNVSVRVLDVNGREVYNNTLASNTANINAATWQNGVYFVTLINGENKRVIKVVK